MKVNYYKFKDCKKTDVILASDEDMMVGLYKNEPELFKDRYSYVSFAPHKKSNSIYVGATNIFGDLLVKFNVRTKEFVSCDFPHATWNGEQLWTPLEVKIHKGLNLDEKEDAIYFGTASLAPFSLTVPSKGGQLTKYSIKDGTYELLARPVQGDFYQGTLYDGDKKMVYFWTFGNSFGVYDIKKKALIRHIPIGSVPHIGVIDDDGHVWGSCSIGSPYLYRYIPEKDEFQFLQDECPIPDGNKAVGVMYSGAGPIDGAIKGANGLLYFGTSLGALLEVDPKNPSIKYLGKPFPGNRLPGLAVDDDGNILMCGGDDGTPYVAKYDIKTGAVKTLGKVIAEDGNACFRCHEIAYIDGKIFVAETDNPHRTGYLWEIEL